MESAPTTSMQQQWFDNILERIPEFLRNQKDMRDVINELFEEITEDFETSMKKSMGMFTCVKESKNPKELYLIKNMKPGISTFLSPPS